MKREHFDFSGQNKTALPGYIWLPEGEVKAVVQIAHGMTEHILIGMFLSWTGFAAHLCCLMESKDPFWRKASIFFIKICFVAVSA